MLGGPQATLPAPRSSQIAAYVEHTPHLAPAEDAPSAPVLAPLPPTALGCPDGPLLLGLDSEACLSYPEPLSDGSCLNALEASLQPQAIAGSLPVPLFSIYILADWSFYKEGYDLPTPTWHVWDSSGV